MYYWNRSPMGRLLLLWVGGILLANYINPIVAPYWPAIILILLFALILLEGLRFHYRQQARIAFVVLLGLLPFALSCWNSHLLNERNSPTHYIHCHDSVYRAAVRIMAPAEEKPKTIKLTVNLLYYSLNHQRKPMEGKMWLYVNKNRLPLNGFWPGQILYVQLKPTPIPQPNLPGAFDVAQYAAHQQVYASSYIAPSAWCFIDSQARGLAANQVRITHWLKRALANGIKNPQALGIAEALLFGYRADIDNTIWQAYARSGIVHVIAISGMHLGLIYTSLVFLFSFLPGRKRTAIIPALLCLWLFAWITGMPASVLRAAWMFTLIGLGELMQKNNHNNNALLASAFLILIVDPTQWFDVGFQLSYLAVLSLHIFYLPIYQKIAPLVHQRLLPLAQLIAATLSAQMLTTPWMLYLFHQVPLWVLLTNLIAVPWSTLLIYAELIWVFLFPWHNQLHDFGHAMSMAIIGLNNMALWVSQQTNAVWQTAVWSLVDVALIYAALAAAYFSTTFKKPKYVLIFLWALAGLSASTSYETYVALQQKGCIVYFQKPDVAIQWYANGQYYLMAKAMPEPFWRYQWQPTMAALHLDSNNRLPVQEYHRNGFHALSAVGRTVVYAEKPWPLKKMCSVDVLVLGPQCKPGPWLTNWHSEVGVVCSYRNVSAYHQSFRTVYAMPQSGAWQGFTSP